VRRYLRVKSDETTAVGAPLRDPAFQRLGLGLSISYLGDQFTIIALLWFVLQLTGSGAAVGLVILCFDLPGVVTGAILGRLLDRYQPWLVMGFDNLARAALTAAIPTLYALGWLQLWHVFVLALLAGALIASNHGRGAGVCSAPGGRRCPRSRQCGSPRPACNFRIWPVQWQKDPPSGLIAGPL